MANLLNSGIGQNVIVAEDFNTTISPKEIRGRSLVRDPFGERLQDLISDWERVDFPRKKNLFTWKNRRLGPGHIPARLDRILIHISFLLKGHAIQSMIIPMTTSNNKPIAPSLEIPKDQGPIACHFNF